MSRPASECLACSAAIRDAVDLLEAAVAGDAALRRAELLVTGMDTERMWRCLLFLAAAGGSAVLAYAEATRLPTGEVLAIIRDEMTGVDHGH